MYWPNGATKVYALSKHATNSASVVHSNDGLEQHRDAGGTSRDVGNGLPLGDDGKDSVGSERLNGDGPAHSDEDAKLLDKHI